MKDLTGQKFGDLTAINPTRQNKRKQWFWNCSCACGNSSVEVFGGNLRSGHTLSCGCRLKNFTNKTHGLTKDFPILHRKWRGMIRRCTDAKDPSYYKYGERGISVDPSWFEFEEFHVWSIRNNWTESCKLEIDRINNNGPYSPENCRLVTHKVNSRNKENTRVIEYNGVTSCLQDIYDTFGDRNIPYSTVKSRLDRGWSVEDSLYKDTQRKFKVRVEPTPSKSVQRNKSFILTTDIIAKLEAYCNNHGCTQSSVITALLTSFFNISLAPNSSQIPP